jgi:hypothetical protein
MCSHFIRCSSPWYLSSLLIEHCLANISVKFLSLCVLTLSVALHPGILGHPLRFIFSRVMNKCLWLCFCLGCIWQKSTSFCCRPSEGKQNLYVFPELWTSACGYVSVSVVLKFLSLCVLTLSVALHPGILGHSLRFTFSRVMNKCLWLCFCLGCIWQKSTSFCCRPSEGKQNLYFFPELWTRACGYVSVSVVLDRRAQAFAAGQAKANKIFVFSRVMNKCLWLFVCLGCIWQKSTSFCCRPTKSLEKDYLCNKMHFLGNPSPGSSENLLRITWNPAETQPGEAINWSADAKTSHGRQNCKQIGCCLTVL